VYKRNNIMFFIILILILLLLLNSSESYSMIKNLKKYTRTCLNDIENNDIITNNMITYTSNGKERRALRAIANRMKQDQTLLILPSSISFNDNFIKNVIESLESKEMILLKFNDIKKKSEVKQVMVAIQDRTKSELVQVLGHTALIYKEKKDNKSIIRKALNDELERTKEI